MIKVFALSLSMSSFEVEGETIEVLKRGFKIFSRDNNDVNRKVVTLENDL